MKRRESDHITYDRSFYVNGHEELCHHTGYEVYDENCKMWFYEFVDHNGEMHY